MDLGAKLSGIYHFTKTKNRLRNLTFKNNWVAGGKGRADICTIETAKQQNV